MTTAHDIFDEVGKILNGHEIDCRCAVCQAFVDADSPSEGWKAAANALWNMKAEAGEITIQ